MNDGANEFSVEAVYAFRGVEYNVILSTEDGKLSIHVQDLYSADEWRGGFDAAYIEDLTHKTGNFKQFNIFANMLETALNKTSEAVSLDLLTYSDLESLRNRRQGSSVGSRPTSTSGNKSSVLNTKRYLILTYTVEFDRIHYPLPLVYHGKPEARDLQETIRQLRSQIFKQKAGFSQNIGSTPTHRNDDYNKLKADYAMLLEERDHLEEEFNQYRRDMKQPKGHHSRELKSLRTLVKHMEEELLKERTKYKKLAGKKAVECKQLMEELDDSRAAERNLIARVKSLTNELAFYKRNRINSPTVSVSQSGEQTKSAGPIWSCDRHARSRSHDRGIPRARSLSRDRAFRRSDGSPTLRQSQERMRRPHALNSQERKRPPQPSAPLRSRSPSPGAYVKTNLSRFDPTAYVIEKRRKQQESELRGSREIRCSQTGSGGRRPRSSPGYMSGLRRSNSNVRRYLARSGSVESLASQSDGDRVGQINTSQSFKRTGRSVRSSDESPSSRHKYPSAAHRSRRNSGQKDRFSPDRSRDPLVNQENLPPNAQPQDYLATTDEISEIDARLKRLQQYMANNMIITS